MPRVQEQDGVRRASTGSPSEMRDQSEATEDPLWATGDLMFRVSGAGTAPDRLVKVHRPFAVVGRAAETDLPLMERAASARHVYLHLDPRGLYAVDLVTRTGTRINGTSEMVGWLRPGDWIEVAGRRIELLRMRVNGFVIDPPQCNANLLVDGGEDSLAGLTLEPRRSNDSPWVLGSELVFLGWSASCGIQIKDTSVSRTHCALVRTATGVYLVDLCGRQTWVEDRPVRGASIVHDGDLITIGSTQFTARVTPPSRSVAAVHPPDIMPHPEAGTGLARLVPYQHDHDRELVPVGFPINPELVPAETQTALLAWIMGTIQGSQGEILRRQGEFHLAITEVLRQMQQDSATLLNTHLQRIESIDKELAALRAEIERRNAVPPVRLPTQATPLRIDRPTPSPDGNVQETASTTWLLTRVNQLETENRSAWKDLLGRLSQSRGTS
ncbi:MAG: hypothetical protein NVSMB9_04360 [Isosphaeraceae bacterium]